MTTKPDWAAYKRKEREARREAGLVAVTVWVPPSGREAVKELAERLRQEAEDGD